MLTQLKHEELLNQTYSKVNQIHIQEACMIAYMALELKLRPETILAVEQVVLRLELKKARDMYFKPEIERFILAAILAFADGLDMQKYYKILARLDFDKLAIERLAGKVKAYEPIKNKDSATCRLMGLKHVVVV